MSDADEGVVDDPVGDRGYMYDQRARGRRDDTVSQRRRGLSSAMAVWLPMELCTAMQTAQRR